MLAGVCDLGRRIWLELLRKRSYTITDSWADFVLSLMPIVELPKKLIQLSVLAGLEMSPLSVKPREIRRLDLAFPDWDEDRGFAFAGGVEG